jgi:hypothetical protein
MDNQINLNSETSMYPELLANSEKLISEHERVYFEKVVRAPTPPAKKNKCELYDVIEPCNTPANQIPSLPQICLSDKIPEKILEKVLEKIPEKILEKVPEKIPEKVPEILSQDETLRKKLHILRELEKLTARGIKLRKVFNMDSDLAEMELEFNTHKDEKSKHNSVRLMGSGLVIIVNLLQMANDQYNPFDFKLDGWKDCIVSDMDSYYDVLGEIYDKHYKVGSSSPPEMKLLMLLIGSAMTLQMQKCMNSFAPNLMNNSKQPEQSQQPQQPQQPEQPKVNKTEENFKKFLKKEQEKKNKVVEEQINDMEYINKEKKEYDKITKNAESFKGKLILSTDKNDDDDISVSSKSIISINPDIDNILSMNSNIRYDEISMGKSLSGKKKKK